MAIRSFFGLMRQSNRVYERLCQEVIGKWGLNGTSFQVMMFIANYPEYNTARDLCRQRGMKTGIASVAVDQLVEAGLLERRVDAHDRRITRLFPTEKATPLIAEGRARQEQFYHRLNQTLTEEEKQMHTQLILKIKDVFDQMEQELDQKGKK